MLRTVYPNSRDATLAGFRFYNGALHPDIITNLPLSKESSFKKHGFGSHPDRVEAENQKGLTMARDAG